MKLRIRQVQDPGMARALNATTAAREALITAAHPASPEQAAAERKMLALHRPVEGPAARAQVRITRGHQGPKTQTHQVHKVPVRQVLTERAHRPHVAQTWADRAHARQNREAPAQAEHRRKLVHQPRRPRAAKCGSPTSSLPASDRFAPPAKPAVPNGLTRSTRPLNPQHRTTPPTTPNGSARSTKREDWFIDSRRL